MGASAADTTITDKLLGTRSIWGPFIGGRFVTPASARTMPVREAATGPVIASTVAAVMTPAAHTMRRAGSHPLATGPA